jgi:ankyrin repeat protein
MDIYTACSKGYVNLVKRALNNGHDIDQLDEISNHTLLSIAISNTDLPMIRMLLKSKANVNIPSGYTLKSPLHSALKRPYTNKTIVKLLLRLGADVNSTISDDNLTPIQRMVNYIITIVRGICNIVILRESFKMIKLLLDYGADPYIKNGHGDDTFDIIRNNDMTNYEFEEENLYQLIESNINIINIKEPE